MLHAVAFIRASDLPDDAIRVRPFAIVELPHDSRHLRRKVFPIGDGDRLLVDLPEAVALEGGDVLVLDDGRHIRIVAAAEELHEVVGRDPVHMAELAWHIGNRHLSARIEAGRILILRDHVIRAMLTGLGARVVDVLEPFEPVRGAYAGHGGGHHHHHGDHDHRHAGHHGHDHGLGGHDHSHRHPDDAAAGTHRHRRG